MFRRLFDNGALIKTWRFPRAVLPMPPSLHLAQSLLPRCVHPLMLLLLRTRHRHLFCCPLFLLLQVAPQSELAWPSRPYDLLRDIRQFLGSRFRQFWTTPIIYDFNTIPGPWQWLVLFSPLSSYVLAYQRIFYYGAWPGMAVTVIAVSYAVVALSAGVALFSRYEREFSEQL